MRCLSTALSEDDGSLLNGEGHGAVVMNVPAGHIKIGGTMEGAIALEGDTSVFAVMWALAHAVYGLKFTGSHKRTACFLYNAVLKFKARECPKIRACMVRFGV